MQANDCPSEMLDYNSISSAKLNYVLQVSFVYHLRFAMLSLQ